MDNFFEILIYLIIIISFLSSIFKKRQQQQKKPPARQPERDENYQAEVSTSQAQTKDYDVLRELEDFFKGGDVPIDKRTPIPQQQTETVPSMGEHVKSESWEIETPSEHLVDDWDKKRSEVKKIMSGVDSAIEKKAAEFEETLWKKKSISNNVALSIRSKFNSPSTLKEYIIFSEIFGKPKALRK